jgi:hypothetical protein
MDPVPLGSKGQSGINRKRQYSNPVFKFCTSYGKYEIEMQLRDKMLIKD